MLRQCLIFTLLLFLTCGEAFSQGKEIRDPNKRPKDFLTPAVSARYMKTKEYRKAHEQLERTFWWVLEPDEKNQVLSKSKTAVLKIITSDKDFWKLAHSRFWCAKNASDIAPDLVSLITDSRIVGLKGYADLIIPDRIASGDLTFFGHGWVVPDDLFSVAGRASWILREITGQHFGHVSMKATPAELNKLSESWKEWFKKNPFVNAADNKRLQRTGISVPLIDNLPLAQLSPGR